MFQKRKEYRIEFRIVRADGAERWLTGAGRVIWDTEGKPVKMIGVNQDITERKRAEEALRANERMLREAQRAAGLGSYEMDVVTGMWRNSEVLDEIFGIGPEYVRNVAGWAALVEPKDREEMVAYVENEVFGSGKDFDRAYRITRASDGAQRWVHGLGKLERDAEGRVVRMWGTIQDITERKAAEDALKASEEKYRLLTESIFDVVWKADVKQQRILYVSPSIQRLVGYTPEEYKAISFDATLSAESSANVKSWVAKRMERLSRGEALPAEPITGELEYVRKDGSKVWAEVVVSYHVDARTGRLELNGVSRDIAERKRAEEEIRLLKQSIDLHSDGAYWFDTENRIVYVNEAGCRAVGFTREELMGQHLSQVNPGATEAGLAMVWEKLRATGRHTAETMHRRKDGTEYPVEISCTLVKFGGKEYNCGFARDVSERRKAEAEIGRHQAAVAHLARLNVMGQMATGLAHELNQPLTAIRNYAHYCRTLVETEGQSAGALPEALKRIDQAVARASGIIQRMREFVRKDPPARKEMDVNKTIRKCLALMEPALNQQRIQVERVLAKQLPAVVADEVQVEQVVVNLIQNAVDAMAEMPLESKTIRVETSVTGESTVAVAIADRGCGIAAENVERIFDEFFTTKNTGTGLGLSISKRIVESHGGRLTARGNPGGGTIFELVLPLKKGS